LDSKALAKVIRERPAQFGWLRGKTWLLGDSRDRKAAKTLSSALSKHIEFAGATWERRLERNVHQCNGSANTATPSKCRA